MRFVLVLVLAAALGGGVYLFTRSPGGESAGGVDPGAGGVPPTDADTDTDGVELVTPRTGDDPGGTVSSGVAAPDPTLMSGVSSAKPVLDTSNEGYLDRYGHMTQSELALALAALKEKVKAEQERLLEARFASGNYDTQVVGGPAMPPLVPAPDGSLPVHTGRANTSPNGVTESRRAVLPFDEYPRFYDLVAEQEWLAKQVGG